MLKKGCLDLELLCPGVEFLESGFGKVMILLSFLSISLPQVSGESFKVRNGKAGWEVIGQLLC